MINVYDCYLLGQRAGKYDKNLKTLERKGMKLESDWADRMSADFENTGRLYLIDEVATKEREERLKQKEEGDEVPVTSKRGRKPKEEPKEE